jgi:hypothetical protein
MVEPVGAPYTPEELSRSGDGFPERGVYCSKCRTFIPQFSALSSEDSERLRALAQGDSSMAIAELQRITSCPPRWAKLWVVHGGQPSEPRVEFRGPPCPSCGKSLRTESARQCPHCLATWHVV